VPLVKKEARMVRQLAVVVLIVCTVSLHIASVAPAVAAAPSEQGTAGPALTGRIVAVGIPGAAGLSPVGVFHPGGPIHDKPEFAAYTQAGQILDPPRLVVVSTSNFGAPLAIPDQAAGSVLSLDVSGPDPLTVPPDFATAGDQASALDGRVQLYTAQSPAFINGVNNPDAITAPLPPVSAPLAISINNAFGRLWFANAPTGLGGPSTESIVDPSGVPLAGAPDKLAGGVFSSDLTNRQPAQLVPGALTSAAIGTALLGMSPDGDGRAVFAVVHADGSVLQAHAELGVDGLAPAHTIHPLTGAPSSATHAGILFNWVPSPILYIADPLTNSIAVLKLAQDDKIFQVDSVSHLNVAGLNVPVDIAPAVPEVVNPAFSSNTTLAGGSDLYAANRGSGTITRLHQDGTVVATRQVELPDVGPLGADQLNGIAVSPDAQKIWITLSGNVPGIAEGTVVELPAFGS
jgi:hypothetical protein